MIPNKLKDWNFGIVRKLIEEGLFETEKFDFKKDIPHKNDNIGKERLEKSVCAFANTEGGFLIFGIKDDKSLSVDERIIGIDPKRDFPREIGDKIMNVEPLIYYDFKNPPLHIPKNEEIIHIIEIPKSTNRPHITSKKEFYYRTNKGNVPMNYHQIKNSFVYEERRKEKLKLLIGELLKNKEYAKLAIVPQVEIKKRIALSFLDQNVLQYILIDAENIIEDKKIINKLMFIKEKIRILNEEMRLVQMKWVSGGGISKKKLRIVNEQINKEARLLIQWIDELLEILGNKYDELKSLMKFENGGG